MLTRMCAAGPCGIPKIAVDAKSVVTNTTPLEAGLDPAEVRRRNLIPADAFPYETASGARYDSGDYAKALDLALEHSGYEELRAEQRRRREGDGARQIGIGLCAYIEITNGFAEPEWGSVEITTEGGAIVRTGLGPTGQGHQTALAMVVADRLGLPFE